MHGRKRRNRNHKDEKATISSLMIWYYRFNVDVIVNGVAEVEKRADPSQRYSF